MTPTCEEVKVQVLWELYWLLLAQTAKKKDVYWARWRALQRQRQRIRWRLLNRPQPSGVQPHDFQNSEPVSLRAVNAALFVMLLQAPRFCYRPGKEVTLTELLLLANAPQPVFHEEDVRLRHASGVVTAFLDSPLCSDEAWLRKRFTMPVPLIPRRIWRMETDSPNSAADGEPPTSAKDRVSPTPFFHHCRPGRLPYKSSGSVQSSSPLLHPCRRFSSFPNKPGVPRQVSSPDLPSVSAFFGSPLQLSTVPWPGTSTPRPSKPVPSIPPLQIGAMAFLPPPGLRRHAPGRSVDAMNGVSLPPKTLSLPPLRN
eukprot:GGOE01011777.1.p1 GENE.GGOE01011777.1~~GGOE01011777.1.p1  ORF type:complete len:312 (+),score=64.39 GGOE01011777.1:251-1186(+)